MERSHGTCQEVGSLVLPLRADSCYGQPTSRCARCNAPVCAKHTGGEHHCLESDVLGRAQVQTAWALARWFGHGWACVPEVASAVEAAADNGPTAVDADTLSALAEEGDLDGFAITGPSVEPDAECHPVVIHTTGSGRLRWAVHPDGSVAVQVHRPGAAGVVLTLTIGAPGHRDIHIAQTGPAALRHLGALTSVVEAITRLDDGRTWEGEHEAVVERAERIAAADIPTPVA